MNAVVVVMLVAVMFCVVLVGGAVWMVALALRRLRRLTRRVTDRAALSVRAYALPPGGTREVARLRLELRAGIDQTRRVLEDVRRNCPLGELPLLFRRVERLAESVDAELRVLEPDAGGSHPARLDSGRRRSRELVAMAATIRRVVSGVYADLNSDLLPPLQHDVDLELQALRAGAAAVRRPGPPGSYQDVRPV